MFSNFTKTLYTLQDFGIELCLDKLETGYSFLSGLHQFPVPTLKIERSFVANLSPNYTEINLIQTILFLAKRLKLKIGAPGIETQAQLEILSQLGCHIGQGYFFPSLRESSRHSIYNHPSKNGKKTYGQSPEQKKYCISRG